MLLFLCNLFFVQVYDGQVCGSGGCGSSNDTSSDSSTSAPPLSAVTEYALPGVVSTACIHKTGCVGRFVILIRSYFSFLTCLMWFQLFAQGSWYLPFVLLLEHIGITKGYDQLTEAAHLLSQICPPHKQTVERLTEALLSKEDSKLRDMLYGPEPPTVAYNMQVRYP